MLPSTIPIFPLPNVVLFPSVCLPLHIFEPRYRQMLADALSGDRIIGMVLQKAGREPGPAPPVYDIGCAGLITHAERLPDGRSNIVLRGIERFRIVAEVGGRAYRRAEIAPLPETDSERIRDELRRLRSRLDPLLAGQFDDARWRRMVPADMGDDALHLGPVPGPRAGREAGAPRAGRRRRPLARPHRPDRDARLRGADRPAGTAVALVAD